LKHTGRWSVSLPSLSICVHEKLQICKGLCRGSGRSASLWRPAIHVDGQGWHQDLKQMFIGQQNFISRALLVGEFVGWSFAFNYLNSDFFSFDIVMCSMKCTGCMLCITVAETVM